MQLRLLVEKFLLPDLLLCLPVDNVSLLNRPPECNLGEVFARGELRADINIPVAVAGEAIRDDAGCRRRVRRGRGQTSFDGVGTIVDDERFGRPGWARGFRAAMAWGHYRSVDPG